MQGGFFLNSCVFVILSCFFDSHERHDFLSRFIVLNLTGSFVEYLYLQPKNDYRLHQPKVLGFFYRYVCKKVGNPDNCCIISSKRIWHHCYNVICFDFHCKFSKSEGTVGTCYNLTLFLYIIQIDVIQGDTALEFKRDLKLRQG